jgi:hypothetical protein
MFGEVVVAVAGSSGKSPMFDLEERVALASEATGTGHMLGDFDAAILHELVERGRDGLAARVETRLAGSGRSLQQNGQPVTDAAARKQIVEHCPRDLSGIKSLQVAGRRRGQKRTSRVFGPLSPDQL